ncbi:MAG: B12-binding domain-containing radical SAM protein [Chitinispirillaceae bacterium]
MPKTALIINPYIFDFKLYDEWMHPTGLYFLIHYLQESGFETHYINCLERPGTTRKKRYNTGDFPWTEIEKPELYNSVQRKYKMYGISPDDFKTKLSRIPSPDVICVGSMMTYWLPGVSETIRLIRCVHPKSPLVVGGIAAQLFGDYVAKSHPDIVLAHKDCEIAGIRFSNRIADQNWTPGLIAGIKAAGNVPHGPVLTSLGCPLSCSYCASKKLQPRFTHRPPGLVSQEIHFMSDSLHIRDFAFYDDALLAKAEGSLFPLAEKLGNLKNKLRFHTPNGLHLKYLNRKVLDCLKSLNVTTLRFGYETAMNRYRNSTDGKITSSLLQEKTALLRATGFVRNVGIYLMAGLPEQKPEDVLEEMDKVSSCGVMVKPVFLSPVPGTPLFNVYSKQFPQLLADPLWHNDTFFITKLPGWNSDAMEKVRKKAKELNCSLS